MFTISIVGDKEVIARMNARRTSLLPAINASMQAQAIMLVAYIQTQKLQNGPLHHRSGRLQQSIKQEVTNNGSMITAKVYTNVEYAAIHEYGGQTPAHDIFPKKASVLAFMMNGAQVFAKSVHHPGSKIPERSFMRSSLDENKEKIKLALQTTVRQVMNEP